MSHHIREGRCAVRPYLFCKPDMVEFIQHVFGAKITAQYDTPIGAHVEALIEDSVLVMETADEFPDGVNPTKASTYLYVPDVDDVFTKAMSHGATSIAAPEDKPYDERQCGILDSFGNTWWISTYIAPK